MKNYSAIPYISSFFAVLVQFKLDILIGVMNWEPTNIIRPSFFSTNPLSTVF